MFKTQTLVTIDKSFRNLIQSHNYEKYILDIINKSKTIFPNHRFKHIDDQSHGESDFKDNHGELYEAKLLFDKKQGTLIGEQKNDLNDWLQTMLDEAAEFEICIKQRDLSLVTETKLYKITNERLRKINQNENAFLFIPFPIVEEYKDSIFLQFTSDFLQVIFDWLKQERIIDKRKVYFIYPSGSPHEYVLRDCDKRIKEYICCEELDDFISFQTHISF